MLRRRAGMKRNGEKKKVAVQRAKEGATSIKVSEREKTKRRGERRRGTCLLTWRDTGRKPKKSWGPLRRTRARRTRGLKNKKGVKLFFHSIAEENCSWKKETRSFERCTKRLAERGRRGKQRWKKDHTLKGEFAQS